MMLTEVLQPGQVLAIFSLLSFLTPFLQNKQKIRLDDSLNGCLKFSNKLQNLGPFRY